MFQRGTVSGQRWGGLMNGVLIGCGLMLFAIGLNPVGLVIAAIVGGSELWQRSLSKKLPDSSWKWDTSR